MTTPVENPLGAELESLADFDAQLAAHGTLAHCTVQSLDLGGRLDALARVDVRGAVLLGCTMPLGVEGDLRARGALVFPRIPELPFNPYRAGLYGAEELYAGVGNGAYDQCPDALVYAWHRAQGARPGIDATLSMALHDHAISDELDELCADHDPQRTIGIMGGHAAKRGSETFAAAARLSAELTRSGHLVMSGGGPGAMEAANLGAWLAHRDGALDEALALLGTTPDFADDITAWVRTALEVRRRWPDGASSVGIPTWFYGHEPPNAFASSIAKYFSNAIREDTLLQRCRGGIVYLPGAAGTVQEVFQAATGNYYAAPGARPTPMVLVGVEHWTQKLPVWPLLRALGEGREMSRHLYLVDHVDQAAEVLLG